MKNKNEKKVSIVIPIFNVEGYLDECLKSITNQTYKNIEIICINDCSTDSSYDILKKYGEVDSRIIIYNNKKNKGLSYTRNVGIEKATGEYIIFVDSDDYVDNSLIETCISVVDNCDMVCFDYFQFNEDMMELDIKTYLYSMNEGVYSGYEYFIESMKTNSFIISACSKLYSKRFLIENSIKFYEGIVYEDILFGFESLIRAKKIYSLSKKLYFYRVRCNSIMTKKITNINLESYFINIYKMTKIYLENIYSHDLNWAIEEYIRTISKEFIRVYRNKDLNENIDEKTLLSDKQMKLFSTYSELCIKSGVSNNITKEQIDLIKKFRYLLIYGAGDIARSAIETLDFYDVPIQGIIVTNKNNNKKSLLGNSINNIEEYLEIKDESIVLITTTRKYYSDICTGLKKFGFKNYITAM